MNKYMAVEIGNIFEDNKANVRSVNPNTLRAANFYAFGVFSTTFGLDYAYYARRGEYYSFQPS